MLLNVAPMLLFYISAFTEPPVLISLHRNGSLARVCCTYLPYHIINVEYASKGCRNEKKGNLASFYELFHHFGWSVVKNECNMCNKNVKSAITKHVLTNCSKLSSIKKHHFQRAHNILTKLRQLTSTSYHAFIIDPRDW